MKKGPIVGKQAHLDSHGSPAHYRLHYHSSFKADTLSILNFSVLRNVPVSFPNIDADSLSHTITINLSLLNAPTIKCENFSYIRLIIIHLLYLKYMTLNLEFNTFFGHNFQVLNTVWIFNSPDSNSIANLKINNY